MKRLLPAAVLLSLSSPGYAQENDHSMHSDMQGHMPAHPSKPVSQARSGEDQTSRSTPNAMPMEHSMHGGQAMPVSPGTTTPPMGHSGHAMHGGHKHPMATPGDPPKKPVDKRAYAEPTHVADLTYDPAAMAQARANMMREHGTMTFGKIMLDRLETKVVDGKDGYAWEADAWLGEDIDKLWIKSEGEGTFGEAPEHAEIQALWSHAIGPWLNLHLGARHDFRPDPDRTHAVVGVQGLLPYWLEVNGALFLSQKGKLTARGEIEYDLRITPKLIAQPRAEINFSAQKVSEIGVGSGVTNAEIGLRLRYHVTPQSAPYIGMQWENAFGSTRRFLRRAGEHSSQAAFVLGLRIWF